MTTNTKVTAPTQGTPKHCQNPSQTRESGQANTTAYQTQNAEPGGNQQQSAAAAQCAISKPGENASSFTPRTKNQKSIPRERTAMPGGPKGAPNPRTATWRYQQHPDVMAPCATFKPGEKGTSCTLRAGRHGSDKEERGQIGRSQNQATPTPTKTTAAPRRGRQ